MGRSSSITAVIEEDFSPVAVVGALLADENQRRAVTTFYEKVMTKKEVVERSRERTIRLDRESDAEELCLDVASGVLLSPAEDSVATQRHLGPP